MAEPAAIQTHKLGSLAERINAEHRACVMAEVTALDHALVAGGLLLEVKATLKHGGWIAWLEEHFEGTPRTAQTYKRLAEQRQLVERLKCEAASHLSIAGALRGLAPQAFGPPPVPGTARPSPDQEAKERTKAAKEQKLMRKAEFAIRTGQVDPPADLTTEEANKWGDAVYEAQSGREAHLETLLDVLAHQLHILSHRADPEKVGRYLAVPTNNSEVNEDRAAILEELRAALPWLQQTLEEAEQAQERMQGPE